MLGGAAGGRHEEVAARIEAARLSRVRVRVRIRVRVRVRVRLGLGLGLGAKGRALGVPSRPVPPPQWESTMEEPISACSEPQGSSHDPPSREIAQM